MNISERGGNADIFQDNFASRPSQSAFTDADARDMISDELTKTEEVSFNQMAARLGTRKDVARLFSRVLVMAKNEVIKPTQDEPYGDIKISAGDGGFFAE